MAICTENAGARLEFQLEFNHPKKTTESIWPHRKRSSQNEKNYFWRRKECSKTPGPPDSRGIENSVWNQNRNAKSRTSIPFTTEVDVFFGDQKGKQDSHQENLNQREIELSGIEFHSILTRRASENLTGIQRRKQNGRKLNLLAVQTPSRPAERKDRIDKN